MELISDFLTAHSAWIGLGLLVGLITLFALEKFPPVIVSVASAAIMLVLGYLPAKPQDSFQDRASALLMAGRGVVCRQAAIL